MLTYFLGATSVIIMCSTMLVYILIKYNMININSLMAIVASTITGGLFLPVLKTVFVKLSEFVSVLVGIIVSVGIFFVLIFCISSIITSIIIDKDISTLIKSIPEHSGRIIELLHIRRIESYLHKHFRISIAGSGNINYSEGVLSPVHFKSDIINKKSVVAVNQHYVNADGNFRTINCADGIDHFEVNTLECLEQCIEKAFDFRESGTASDAVLCYMRALELEPDKELASWIVVEICSIYKDLGRYDKIRELAESCKTTENSFFNDKVFYEVEKCLH